MSKSTKRHPAETYQLRDARRLWHVPGPTQAPFGCEGCHQRELCGGLQVETSIFSCLTFCRCANPAECDNVCPKNIRHLVARSQEVGGFELDNVPRTPLLAEPALPSFAPLIYHGSARTERLQVAAVALPLAELISRTDGTLRFTSRAALLAHFQLHDDCQLILSGTDEDPTIERWWEVADREAVIRGFMALGIVAITSPNYSLFADVPRHDNFYNIKRIALAWSEIQREGLPAALHVNARTNRDWERWGDFIATRPEVTMIAFEFGTGAGAKGRIDWHVDQLKLLAQRAQRKLTLVVRGGSTVLPELAQAYRQVVYLDTVPFVKTQKRQRATISEPAAKLTWQSSPTAIGASLDALLIANINAAADYIGRQLRAVPAERQKTVVNRSVKPPLRAERTDYADHEALQPGLLGEPGLRQGGAAAVDGERVVIAAEAQLSIQVGQVDEQLVKPKSSAGVNIQQT